MLKIFNFRQSLLMAVTLFGVISNGISQSLINPAPFVIPPLREWHGTTGVFILKEGASLVLDNNFADVLEPIAKTFQDDLKQRLPNQQITVRTGKPKRNC